jgi:hypothetical protein
MEWNAFMGYETKIRSTKSEIRNKFKIRMTKCSKQEKRQHLMLSTKLSDFSSETSLRAGIKPASAIPPQPVR